MPDSRVTAEQVIDSPRDKVASWWLADAVEFIDELPHAGTGKIDRLKLRAAFADDKLAP